ncbi:E3 ubiquitin-protein ligase CCNB1IP1 homolog isoform X1 [Cryptomeria japonica]|uniref:E3 ubiquitin-protein ligase CCNB1IP1 homolog isoform X1 n=1 Tax=Cryptomeria japonica TaxID=3369 RepID=UPI0027DA1830|nr:E3 ubiquitin-protein ligase CCNB1IP1 homolog isoform X1 [Cryptomeria japonica]XP_059073917.1 E3 ubiquitin-protein ligase CCNB1IP1 homolog isoform X1 [Cryptomeria japonica]
MKCNACWREIEGRAIATACGHILCTEDAGRILSTDSSCPICDQILSKNLMKSVDINPSDEWMNMAMAGVPPQNIMKSAYKGVAFWLGQKDVEMQATVSKVLQQYRGKCEEMQTKFTEKLEQVHTAYQKAVKKIHLMQQEVESLSKDKEELQEKYAEKSRQKRKLEEMYDALRNEYEQTKRSAIQPRNNFLQRTAQDDLFSSPANLLDVRPAQQGQDELDGSNITPVTPGNSNDFWNPPRQRSKTSPVNVFDIAAAGPSAKSGAGAGGNRAINASSFGASKHSLFTPVGNNPSNALRNLILSPMKRQAASRLRPQGFTS